MITSLLFPNTKQNKLKKVFSFYFLHFNLIKKAIRKTSSGLQQFVQHFGGSVIKPCAKEMLVVSNAILANEENAETIRKTSSDLQQFVQHFGKA